MANITRIKAKEDGDKPKKKNGAAKSVEPAEITRKVSAKPTKDEVKKSKKEARAKAKADKKAAKKALKAGKKPFILFRPFVALGHYICDSFREVRMVRWPNRKTTWKLVFSIIGYVILLAVFITLVDMLITYLFNLVFGG